MKPFPILLLALTISLPISRAQESELEEPGLIPEIVTPVPKPNSTAARRADGTRKSSTEKASDDQQVRIRYRTVKTKALQDGAIQDEWMRAHRTKTDPERRAGLRKFYRMLYDRMAKIDPSLSKRITIARKTANARIEGKIRTPVPRTRTVAAANADVELEPEID